MRHSSFAIASIPKSVFIPIVKRFHSDEKNRALFLFAASMSSYADSHTETTQNKAFTCVCRSLGDALHWITAAIPNDTQAQTIIIII